ncbi:hypothetical protein ACLKA7_006417 [Drosophila subpalustris]
MAPNTCFHVRPLYACRLSFAWQRPLRDPAMRNGKETWIGAGGLGLGLFLARGNGQWAWPRGQEDDTPAAAYDNVLPLNGGGRWTLNTEDGTEAEAEAEDGAGAGAEPETRHNAC